MSETEWEAVAFAPAPAGWYAVFAEKDRPQYAEAGRRYNMPIAGWLTLEDEHSHSRRFVAAVPSPAGELVPVDLLTHGAPLVTIRGPGEPGRPVHGVIAGWVCTECGRPLTLEPGEEPCCGVGAARQAREWAEADVIEQQVDRG
jgi:hypothetical protein